MIFGTILTAILISVTNLTITEPVDGETYDGDWLTVRAIVGNDNEMADSVHYSLNGQSVIQIPRLNTDWYTYMANDCRTGYSESPAPHDNTILWTAPVTGMEHEFVSPVVVDGCVYHASEEQEIAYCLDAATGSEIWRFENIGDGIDDAMCVRNGKVYLASDSIWCLDALTGERIWTFGDNNSWSFSGPPVPHQGKVFVSSSYIYCLDDISGEEIWKIDSVYTQSSMTAWNNLLFVPEPGSAGIGYLYALNTETSEMVWVDESRGFWDSSPVVVDSTIYIGSMDGSVYAFDALTGSVVWEASGYGFIESTPAIHDGSLFFGGCGLIADYSVYSIDQNSGDLEWEFEIPNGDYLHASCGVADGLVFWGDMTWLDSVAVIHAVDEETGSEVWSYIIEGASVGVLSSPSIVNGVMYIGAGDGNLYAFGTGLKYTYRDDLYADVGSNQLIVTAFDEGAAFAADTINFTVTQTGITLEPSSRLALRVNPNPFYSAISISFELSETGYTLILVFDLTGRIVCSLAESELGAGKHSYIWNGRSQSGESVSSGIYICRIQSGAISEAFSMCLLR